METSLETLKLTKSSKSQLDEPSSSRQRVDKKKASKGKRKLNEHPIKYTIALHKNGEDVKEKPEYVSDEELEDEPMDAEEGGAEEIAEDAEEIDEDAEESGAEEIDEDAAENPPEAEEIDEVAEQNAPAEEEKVSKGKEVMVEEEKVAEDGEGKIPKIRKFISGRQLLRRLKEGLFGRTVDLAEHLPKIIESNLKYEVDIPADDDFYIRDYPGECDKLIAGVVPAIWIFNDYGDRFPLTYEVAISAVEFALESYNDQHDLNYELVSIEKVNMKAGDIDESKYFSEFFTYSINFTANDVVLGKQTFRAKLEHYGHDHTPWYIIYCKTKNKKKSLKNKKNKSKW